MDSKSLQQDILKSELSTGMVDTHVPAETGITQKHGQKKCLEKRSNSDSCFPVVNVEDAKSNNRQNEKRLFNFSGVPKRPTSVSQKLCQKHRSSSSNDCTYFSPVDYQDKQESQLTSQMARISLSEDCIAQPTQMKSLNHKNSNTETSRTISSSEPDHLTLEQNVSKVKEEDLAKEAVGRLRKKIQKLNSPGRTVSFALNNQMDDVEENTQNSLLHEYRNFQTKHYGGHRKTLFKSSRSNSRQNTREK